MYASKVPGLPFVVSDAAIKLKELDLELDAAAETELTDQEREEKEKFVEFLHKMKAGGLFMDYVLSQHQKLPHLGNAYVAKCYACEKFSLWAESALIFPLTSYTGEEPNPDLSADIAHDYNEARSIATLSPRGAAALLRLAIQKLCKELGATDKTIDDAIASLVRKGLDVQVQQALDIVRVIGNEAVHPGEMDMRDDISTVNTLFGLVNLIADRMISQPKKLAALYNKLPANKLKGIEQRDKKP